MIRIVSQTRFKAKDNIEKNKLKTHPAYSYIRLITKPYPEDIDISLKEVIINMNHKY